MTKEMYERYDGLLHCRTCNKDVPKINMYYRRVSNNGSVNRCNVCEWINKHPDKLEYKNFTRDNIIEFLHFIFYNKSIYLNDIIKTIHCDIEDAIDLFQFLNIGNKKCEILVPCEYCGKFYGVKPQVYVNTKYHYCSKNCYYTDKSNKMPKGNDNVFYKRVDTFCTNCNMPISIIPYKFNQENKYGDSHHFCSKECYWKYRSKYYVGDKTFNYRREYTEEEKNRQRMYLLNRLDSDDRLNTAIQCKIDKYLSENNIEFIREKYLITIRLITI